MLGDKAREHGFELPNPLGVAGSFYLERQDFEIADPDSLPRSGG